MVEMNTGKIFRTILTSSTCFVVTENLGRLELLVIALLRKLRSSVISSFLSFEFDVGDTFVLTTAFLPFLGK